MSELRKHLLRSNRTLGSRLHLVWEEAKRGIHDKIQADGASAGGLAHSEAVESNIWRLHRELTLSLKPVDLFVASAAAALHDSAKVPEFSEPGQDHGRLAAKIIRERHQAFQLEQHQAVVVGMVVGPHNDGNLDPLPAGGWALGRYGTIEVHRLAGLFRLADVLDIAERVSPQVADPDRTTPKEVFRRCVGGWRLVEHGRAVCIDAVASTPHELNIITGGVEKTAGDLEQIATALQRYGLPYRFTTPNINTDQIEWVEEKKAREARALIGLDYFDENDAEAFKGRDRETQELQGRVIGNPVSLLVGASGAGKTSLIRAGLLPKMKRAGWKCVVTRPWLPSNELVRREDFKELLGHVPEREATLADMAAALAEKQGDSEILLCLDQFENATELLALDTQGEFRSLLSMVQSGRLSKVHLLIAYRVEAEAPFGRLWQEVAGSAAGLPRMYLNPLDRPGAEQALADALARGKTGLKARAALMKRIADDLELETRKSGHEKGVYPPYLRILAETIIGGAHVEGVFTEKMYADLGGAAQMIGEYLFKTLDRLGDDRDDGRRILVALTSSAGKKDSRSVRELAAEAQVEERKLKKLLSTLTDLRLVRPVGPEYEIAHDYLADLVRRELVERDPEEIEFKALREMLAAKTRSYMSTRALLTVSEMRSIYRHRTRITPSGTEQLFLLRSLLSAHSRGYFAPGWFWLRSWGVQKAHHALFAILSDKKGHMRGAAAKALAGLAKREDLPRIESLLGDKENTVRENALRAFVRLVGRHNLRKIEALLRDPDLDVQQAGVLASARVVAPRDLPKIECFLQDTHYAVRMAAVEAFGKLGTRRDLPKIEPLLHDGAGCVRRAAIQAFGGLVTREDLPKVKRLLGDKDPDVRRAATRALVRIAGRKDLPGIERLLKERDPVVQETVRETLVRIVTREDLPIIENLLRKDNQAVQLAALEMLARVVTHDEIPTIRRLLAGTDGVRRRMLMQMLLKVGTRESVPEIDCLLLDSDQHVRWAATKALERLGTREDLPKIERLLQDEDWDVQRAAADTFVSLVTHEDLPTIERLLGNQDWIIWGAACKAFVRVARREDLPKIESLLANKDEKVRKAALLAHGKLIARQDLPRLASYLLHKDWRMQHAAVEAYAKLGTRRDLPKLEPLLGHRIQAVRRRALMAYTKVGTRQDLRSLFVRYKTLKWDIDALLDRAAYMPKCLRALGETGTSVFRQSASAALWP